MDSTLPPSLNSISIEELPDAQVVFVDTNNQLIHAIKYDPMKAPEKNILLQEIQEGLHIISSND